MSRMMSYRYVRCQSCEAPSSKEYSHMGYTGYCEKCEKDVFEEEGDPNTIWCSSCHCPCSKSSDPDVSTCITCTNEDLADMSDDSSTESASQTEEKKADDQLYSKLRFLHLDFHNPGDGVMKGDVAIVVQGITSEQLYAHKFILASKSPVFCKMLESNMLEAQTGMIRIDDASLPVMRAVIKFCYNAEISFTHRVTSEDVLVVAHKYGIDLLQKTCEEDLIKTMNKHNFARKLRMAMKYDAHAVQAAATKKLKKHFDKLISVVLEELR